MMTQMSERRSSRRFDLSLPVKVRFPYPIDCPSRNGNTRDISTRGVYFVVPGDGPEIAAELDLEITLPGVVTGGTDVFVRALPKVVRVEELMQSGELNVGVAVMIDAYEIVRQETMAAAG
jgi:hypothetical protein